MNRWLLAAVIGLMGMGCAVGVEDPQPGPSPDPVQKEPPAQPFSGELTPVQDPKLSAGGLETDLPPIPFEEPPMPGQ